MVQKILAVSTDPDWQSFGEKSNFIDVTDDLAEALALFQPSSEATKFCEKLSTNLGTPKTKNITDFIEKSLKEAVPELEVYAEAVSQYFYDPDIPELIYKDFDFISDDKGNVLINPIQVQDKLLAVEIKIRVYTSAYCSFSFSKYDSIDKDYVEIGDGYYEVEHDFTTEVIFLISGDFKKEIKKISFSDFEIIQEPMTVFFGEVDPIWDEY